MDHSPVGGNGQDGIIPLVIDEFEFVGKVVGRPGGADPGPGPVWGEPACPLQAGDHRNGDV